MQFAQKLLTRAPRRAESYDPVGYVAKKAKWLDIAQQAKLQGEDVFGKENALFEELRSHLDA